MAGNDLVDLKQAKLDSNWQRKGFLNKICTTGEQEMIFAAAESDKVFWLLWTMKEAAYKVQNRLTGIRNFYPLQFACTLTSSSTSAAAGEVLTDQLGIFTRSTISNDLIHSVAVIRAHELENLILHQLSYTPDYAESFNAASADYKLIKDQKGLPAMVHRKTGNQYPASVSHHGRYLIIMYSGSRLLTD